MIPRVPALEKSSKSQRLPNTDSMEELARFWDTHDLTDFGGDLEELGKPVFVRASGGLAGPSSTSASEDD